MQWMLILYMNCVLYLIVQSASCFWRMTERSPSFRQVSQTSWVMQVLDLWQEYLSAWTSGRNDIDKIPAWFIGTTNTVIAMDRAVIEAIACKQTWNVCKPSIIMANTAIGKMPSSAHLASVGHLSWIKAQTHGVHTAYACIGWIYRIIFHIMGHILCVRG